MLGAWLDNLLDYLLVIYILNSFRKILQLGSQYINSNGFIILVSQSYFDFDDYEDPIKHYIDTKIYFKLVPGFTKQVEIYVQQNHAEQSDSIFQFQPSTTESSFINVETYVPNLYLENKDEIIFRSYFIKDSKSITYQRSVLTFLDWWGFIGGVNEVLHLAGMLIVSFVSGKTFMLSILSALYQVNKFENSGSNLEVNNLLVLDENKIYKSKKLSSMSVNPKFNDAVNNKSKFTPNSRVKSELFRRATTEMK